MLCNKDAEEISQELIRKFGSTGMEAHPEYRTRMLDIAGFLQDKFNQLLAKQQGGNDNEVVT